VPEAFTGTLRDYGRCATVTELDYCAMETSQLVAIFGQLTMRGQRTAFSGSSARRCWAADRAPHFPQCVRDRAGGHGQNDIDLPPWAVAAARAGFSTLLFDAKGDLAQDLREPIFAAGSRVVIFSTSPEQRSGTGTSWMRSSSSPTDG